MGIEFINNNNNTINQDPVGDTTEVIIRRTTEGIKTFLNPQYGNITPEEKAAALITVNPAIKKYGELKIKILQDWPSDADKLREILRAKQEEYEKAQDSEDIERLVTEIQTFKFVLFLVCHGLECARHYHSSASS